MQLGLILIFPEVMVTSLRYFLELLRVSDIKRRTVLITGCDSGFGNLLAKRLAKNGQKVFAGCLTEKVLLL